MVKKGRKATPGIDQKLRQLISSEDNGHLFLSWRKWRVTGERDRGVVARGNKLKGGKEEFVE